MNFRIERTLFQSTLLVLVAFAVSCGEASKPSAAPVSGNGEPTKAPLVQKTELADWCPEHGVPESVCTRCNAELIPGFQAKGDWCKEHGLPDSQCLACHPELKAKLEALAPKSPKSPKSNG
ncbi:MAG: hypothetical protein HZA53_17010 [Planctomycetes bacterium]|nr:hypothetical protein [Planctomycetota bacterium]